MFAFVTGVLSPDSVVLFDEVLCESGFEELWAGADEAPPDDSPFFPPFVTISGRAGIGSDANDSRSTVVGSGTGSGANPAFNKSSVVS